MAKPIGKIKTRIRRLQTILRTEIWEFNVVQDRSVRGQLMGWLRIFSIAWEGLNDNQLFSKAAALSYSTLIGLGPMVAIIVLFSGSFLSMDAELQIKRALVFVAPTLSQYVTLESIPTDAQHESIQGTAPSDLDLMIHQIVQGAQDTFGAINTGGSTTFGMLGFIALLLVGIQLLTSIENTFNNIWGVHRGRGWGQRVVFYWTLISLGAVLGLGSTALLSASTILKMFEFLPLGAELARMLVLITPFISFLMLVALLTFCYQFFPNTDVKLKPAATGAVLTCLLLFINNYLSILYVHRVITLQSLYGSVGIIPVMMFGLYFFWVFILLGGQLTYAVQNAPILTNRQAWNEVSARTREIVTLAALLVICRRFANSQPSITAAELAEKIRAPGNLLNESLSILLQMGWITHQSIQQNESTDEAGYQPAKPLSKLSMSKFKDLFENHGNSQGIALVQDADPLLKLYCRDINQGLQSAISGESLDSLLEQTPRLA